MIYTSALTTFNLFSVIFSSVNEHFRLDNPQLTLELPSEGACWSLCASEESCFAYAVTKLPFGGVTCDFGIRELVNRDQCYDDPDAKNKNKIIIVPQRNSVTYCKKTCIPTTHFASPLGTYEEGKDFCFHNSAEPFVPKNEKDYYRYVDLSTKLNEWAWYPLNDFKKDRFPVYEDGVEYGSAPFNPRSSWWDSEYPNTEKRKCTTVRNTNNIAWSGCGWAFQFVCKTSRMLNPEDIIMTPLTPYKDALDYCRDRNASPFVPKSEEEYNFYVDKATTQNEWSWYPLNDNKTERMSAYEDGTVYEYASFNPNLWDSGYPNTATRKCVTVSRATGAAWSQCGHKFQLICLKN